MYSSSFNLFVVIFFTLIKRNPTYVFWALKLCVSLLQLKHRFSYSVAVCYFNLELIDSVNYSTLTKKLKGLFMA